MLDITSQLQARFGDRLKLDEPMSKHTNFRLGGPARWYLEVKTEAELEEALTLADEARVRVVIHGGGSNVLYADGPIDAFILVPAFREVHIESDVVSQEAGAIGKIFDPQALKNSPNRFTSLGALGSVGDGDASLEKKKTRMRVTVGAGVLSVMLARKTAEAGLSGLTWMISLPGTVGGAVRGNAGCFGGETKDHLTSVRLLKKEEGKWHMVVLHRDELNMAYRHSILKEEMGKDWVILSATFELESGDKDQLKAELEETLAKRKATQPQNAGCAGCAFKNYEVENDEELARLQEKLEIPESMVKARRLSAGWIIDQLGLKGFAVGKAKVNETHGNFLVSEGATADEVMQLIAVIKTRVRDRLGIQLQEEIQIII